MEETFPPFCKTTHRSKKVIFRSLNPAVCIYDAGSFGVSHARLPPKEPVTVNRS